MNPVDATLIQRLGHRPNHSIGKAIRKRRKWGHPTSCEETLRKLKEKIY